MESVSVKKIKLDDYNVGSTLGTGSFGRVRVAKGKKGYIALKIMKKMEIIKSKQADHIMNEIKILAMINHPFIVFFE
jgi:protein kinase A